MEEGGDPGVVTKAIEKRGPGGWGRQVVFHLPIRMFKATITVAISAVKGSVGDAE